MHDGAAEQQVLQRWEELARAYDVLPAVAALDGRLLDGAGPLVPVHRDLHDKQVLVDDGDVGLLDFDLTAAGEAALDLANLLVHLELRALQGVCSPELARAAADAVLLLASLLLASLLLASLLLASLLCELSGLRRSRAATAAAPA